MRLCLIRHFAPDVAPGVCYGQTDLALLESNDERSPRVSALRQQLRSLVEPETQVFSSPLRRCAAIAAALSEEVAHDARLQELHFGDWEMQAWDDIGVAGLDAWAADLAGFRPPGGETGYEVQRRALSWLRDISVRHQQAIVVTHAGIMRALQAHHQSLPGAQWLNLRYEYGELICLDFESEKIHTAPVQ